MNTASVNFLRQYRTSNSEGFLVRLDGRPIGRLDLHYGVESSYATLIMLQDFDEVDVLDLVCDIDEQLVISAETSRKEFYVTVFRGDETGFYSDEHIDEHRAQGRAGGNGAE